MAKGVEKVTILKGGLMFRDITIKEALSLPGAKFIDVRSESEFAEASLPGSINIPILRDEERALVGTTYKKVGTAEAKKLGLELVSPKLPQMISKYQELAKDYPLVVFCWRGGMRSQSICSLLDTMGVPVYRLIGGYKAYRRYVNQYLDRPLPHKVVVLHGLTGVGKTELLKSLREMQLPAVDLEGLSSNRGSVFGQIGMAPQPSQKMFESLLVNDLAQFEDPGYIIVECESRRVGRIILPASLVDGMRNGIKILTYCPVDIRTERIIRIYSSKTEENENALKAAISSLERRLGKNKVAELSCMLDNGQIEDVVKYLLINYYDPLYKYPCQASDDYDFSVDTSDLNRAAEKIRDFLYKVMSPVNLH